MFWEILTACVGSSAFYLWGRINRVSSEIKFHREALEYKLVGEAAKIHSDLNEIKLRLDKSDMKIEFILADIVKKDTKPIPINPLLPPANRRLRTAEQKKQAAEQKKAWWAAKRAKEAAEKAATVANIDS